MSNRRGPRDWQYDGRVVQQPCDRQLRDCSAVDVCNRVQLATGLGQLASCDRKPWYESKLVLLAILQDVLVLAVTYVIQVLHADDLDHLPSLVNLGGLYLTETDMADFALLLQFCNDLERLFDGDLGINAMQLPKVDHFRLQMTQAHFDLLGKILRSANRQPLVGALACQPSLGRNHETFR